MVNKFSALGALTAATALTLAPLGAVNALAPDAYTSVWVANADGDSVSAINPTTFAEITEVSIGGEARNPSVNNAGDTVFVADRDNDEVEIIDAATQTIVDTVTVGDEPYATAVSKNDRTLYVGNKGGDSVSVVNIATGTVTATITDASIDGPEWLAFDNRTNTLIVVSRTSAKVTFIDASDNSVTASASVGSAPRSAVVIGSNVYVGTESETVDVVPLNASLRDHEIDLDPSNTESYLARNIARTQDGAHLIVPTMSSDVLFIDVDDETIDTVTLADGGTSYGATHVYGTDYVFVTNESTVSRILLSTLTESGSALGVGNYERGITSIGVYEAPEDEEGLAKTGSSDIGLGLLIGTAVILLAGIAVRRRA